MVNSHAGKTDEFLDGKKREFFYSAKEILCHSAYREAGCYPATILLKIQNHFKTGTRLLYKNR